MRTAISSIVALSLALTVSVVFAQRAGPERGADDPSPRAESAESRRVREERLTGRFVLAGPPEEAEQRVSQAIDEAVSEMAFLTRGFARGRLREKNPVRRELETAVRGDRVTIAYGDARYETREGQWATVTATGEEVLLVHQVRGNRIFQTFRSDDGEKLTVYSFSPDGRQLWLDVRVTSPRLPSPLRYRLAYRRVGEEPAPAASADAPTM